MNWHITIIYVILTLQFHGQGGFKRQFYNPGSINNHATGIFQKPDGSYIAGGIVTDTIQGYLTNRLAIIGLDVNGHQQWLKKYGNHKFEYFSGGIATPWFYFDRNFLYHTGVVKDSLNKIYGVLIKFDLNGDTIWQKTYKDSSFKINCQRVTKSVDGGLLISGMKVDDSTVGNSPVLVIKTDTNGNELWRKSVNKGFPNTHDGKAILQDSASKKIVTVGYQTIGNASNWWFYDNILILDSLGNKLAQHNFAGPDGGTLTDLIQTKDGKFVAVGFKVYPQMIGGTNLRKSFAVKFDVNTPNPPIWRINFDKLVLNNVFSYIAELDNEDIMIGGTLDTMILHNMNNNNLIRLTRVDKNGAVKWNQYYNYKTNSPGTGNNMGLWSLNRTNDKGFIASIEIANSPMPNPFFFVKFDSTGCDSTLEYCEILASVGSNEKESLKNLVSLFPNPFKNEINIEINNGHTISENLGFRITNLLGKTLIEGNLKEHLNNKPINLVELPSGVYFFEAVIDNRKYHYKILKE